MPATERERKWEPRGNAVATRLPAIFCYRGAMDAQPQPPTVGAVIFPGFELLDVFGPLEFFGILGSPITLLAETPGPVASSAGPSAMAEAALADSAAFDVLLVPGGIGTRTAVKNSALLDLLRARSAQAGLVASVCTGSALLARAGLLDGLKATSNKIAFDWVTRQGPAVKWIRAARWVQDGRVFTSSGVSAGMDMTLALIEHLRGRAESERLARWAEYTWHRNPADDPFA